eukprot:8712010-Ditylum_brightwellii.AAC.1
MGFDDATISSTKPVTDTMGLTSGLDIILAGNSEVNFFKKLRRKDDLVAAKMEMVATATGMMGTAHIPCLALYVTNLACRN